MAALPLSLLLLALARPTTARVDFQRADGLTSCPEEPVFRAAIAARLGRDPFAVEGPLTLRVRFYEEPRLGASIEWVALDGTASGQRSFNADEQGCRELAQRVELAVSLLLDLDIPVAPDRRPIREAPPTAAVPKPPVSAVPPPQPPDRTEWVFGAGQHVGAGLMPSLALGADLSAALRRRTYWLAVELQGLGALATRISGIALQGEFFAGSFQLCARTWYFAACPELVVGAAVLQAGGVINPAPKLAPQAIAGLRLVGVLPLGVYGLELKAWGSVGFDLVLNRFFVGTVQLWQTPLFSGSFGLMLSWVRAFDGMAARGQ